MLRALLDRFRLQLASNAKQFSKHTHAVIVGISTYGDDALHDLTACAEEARTLEAALADEVGCGIPPENIELVPNDRASASGIVQALERAASRAQADDTLLFYFAGHGTGSSQGFVLRTPGSFRDESGGLSAERLTEILGRSSAKGIVVILDCCGGAALAESAPEFFTAPTDGFRLLISASRAGQSSWEFSAARKSLFTSRLLKVLRSETPVGIGGLVYFTDLFAYLHDGVIEDVRNAAVPDQQEPVFAGTFGADPLLFLVRNLARARHRNASLEQMRIRTQRITPERLRRSIRFAVGGAVGSIILLLGSYWAVLDSSQYLQVQGDSIVLVHGLPGYTGFGLP